MAKEGMTTSDWLMGWNSTDWSSVVSVAENYTSAPSFTDNITALNTTPAAPAEVVDYSLLTDVTPLLEYIFPPITLTVGLLGNILSFCVFSSKEFNYSLSSVLYRMLAVADASVLITYDGLHNIVEKLTGGSLLHYHTIPCKIIGFTYFYTRTFSAWILVMIGVERFIGILFPHKAKVICTKKRFLTYVVCIELLWMGFYIPTLAAAGLVPLVPGNPEMGEVCSLSQGLPALYPYTREVYPYANLVLGSLLPFAVILITNGGIIYGLVRASRMRAQAATTSAGPQMNSILTTLFAVSFSFILLTLPYPTAMFLQMVYDDQPLSQEYVNVMFLFILASICASLNHSINILMYCLCGRKFRRALVGLICAPCRGRKTAVQKTHVKATTMTSVATSNGEQKA